MKFILSIIFLACSLSTFARGYVEDNGYLGELKPQIEEVVKEINQSPNLSFYIEVGDSLPLDIKEYDLLEDSIILVVDNTSSKARFLFGPQFYKYGHSEAGVTIKNIMHDAFKPTLIEHGRESNVVPLAILNSSNLLLENVNNLSFSSQYITGWISCIVLGFMIFLLLEYRTKLKLYIAAALGGALLVLIGFLVIPYVKSHRIQLPYSKDHTTIIPSMVQVENTVQVAELPEPQKEAE